MTEYREGQTATHPDGRKVVYRGGQWVSFTGPAGTGAPPARPPKLAVREQMQLDEARAAARTAEEAALTAEQFVDINRGQNTGGLLRSLPLATSLEGAWDPDINTMNALTARMAPQQRVPGSGTTSDRDLSLYLQAVPSTSKPGPVNSSIARQARKDAERRSQYAQFLDQFVKENGSLIGAEAAWKARQQQTAAAKPKIPRPAAERWERLRTEGGLDPSKPRGSRENPYIAVDGRTLSRLPKGSYAISPRGELGVIE